MSITPVGAAGTDFRLSSAFDVRNAARALNVENRSNVSLYDPSNNKRLADTVFEKIFKNPEARRLLG